MIEHSPSWQLPPGQSVSVKHDSGFFGNGSSVEAVSDECDGTPAQPANNPRSKTMVRFMSVKPSGCHKVTRVDSMEMPTASAAAAYEAALRFDARAGAFASTSARARSYKSLS
jgi:hypothetical protein